jgi:N-acyl-D-amino-acid deacylase
MSLLPRGLRAEDLPVTGEEVPELAKFDKWMREMLATNSIPGGQLAMARDGEIVYSRGFGYADRDEKTPVERDSLFRIASVSKPITAVAILRLVQQQKLKLTDRIDDVLKIEPHLEPDAKPDERWRDVTVEHCLAHTGGWNRDTGYDPMFAYDRIAKSLGLELPIGTAEIIRYVRGQPLDSTPGEKYAYSNFGYCLLGRVIEKVSGEAYEPFVQREVFAPLSLTAPKIGRSLESQRAAREVRYYTIANEQHVSVVGPNAGDSAHQVPVSYGGWNHEALDAHGGWIASSEDLVRFGAAFDDKALTSSKPLLSAELVKQMFAGHATIRPRDEKPPHGSVHYGLGWVIATLDEKDRPLITHGGALPCTAAVLLKLDGNLNVAALFNLGQKKNGEFLGRGLDVQLAELARKS